jgi:hypothetical protein
MRLQRCASSLSSSNSIASSSVIAFPAFSCHEFSCLAKISLATAWQALHRDRIGPPHCLVFFFFFSFLQSDNSTNSTRANTIACRMLAERIVLLEVRVKSTASLLAAAAYVAPLPSGASCCFARRQCQAGRFKAASWCGYVTQSVCAANWHMRTREP